MSHLTRHKTIAHDESDESKNRFECRDQSGCNKSYKLKTSLDKHTKNVHTKEQILCNYCWAPYKRLDERAAHEEHCPKGKGTLRWIKNEGRFVCPDCNVDFDRKGLVEEHIRTHTGNKPFSCQVCEKRYHKNLERDLHQHECQRFASAEKS